MKFSLIHASELKQDAVLRGQWLGLRERLTMQGATGIYDSPYYHPEFTSIVARARTDARILLGEEAGKLQMIWPFHVLSSMRAEAIGAYLSDYQGPLCSPGLALPFAEVLKAMQVRYFPYNHIPAAIAGFSDYAWISSQSHLLDLSGGFDAYAERLTAKRDASLLKKVATNERKLAKKHGELRFVMQSANQEDYLALLAGKSGQFRRTVGAEHDIFQRAWVMQVMDGIKAAQAPDFAGMLSTLHAGDTLIAAHFGMRSDKVLHYWFPWYDTAYAEFSPGLILLAGCARQAAELGLACIDLGRGEQAYKLRFSTGAHALCEGAISRPAMLSHMQAGVYQGRRYLKASVLGQYLRALRSRSRQQGSEANSSASSD